MCHGGVISAATHRFMGNAMHSAPIRFQPENTSLTEIRGRDGDPRWMLVRYNDASHGYMFGAGAMQADVSAKLGLMVEERHRELVGYGAAQWARAHSAALGRWLAPRITGARCRCTTPFGRDVVPEV